MLNDLAHFRNTVVNDGTCENRPQIKFYVTTKRKTAMSWVFVGTDFFSPKSSKAKYNTLGTSEANFGVKKPRIILSEVRYTLLCCK